MCSNTVSQNYTASSFETHHRRSVAIKLRGSGRVKKVLSLPRGGSGYR